MSIAMGHVAVRRTDRIFFLGMALASAVMLYVGFLPSYFGRSAALPSLSPLYQLHGALFTAWIALLVVQASLVAGRRTEGDHIVGDLVRRARRRGLLVPILSTALTNLEVHEARLANT